MLTKSAGDGLATVVDVLTGTQLTTLKNCSAQPGSTALIAGDFVVSAQVRRVCVCGAAGRERGKRKKEGAGGGHAGG